MVITDVFVHQAFQMPLIEDDHMVEQIPSAVAGPVLCNAILPGASEAGPLGLDSKALHRDDHLWVKILARSKIRYFGTES